MQRSIIVHYHVAAELARLEQAVDDGGNFANHLPIHGLLGSYHWSRLDANHVIVHADFSVSQRSAIENHPTTQMLPHLASSATISSAVTTPCCWNALQGNLALNNSSLMSHVADTIDRIHGPKYAPIR